MDPTKELERIHEHSQHETLSRIEEADGDDQGAKRVLERAEREFEGVLALVQRIDPGAAREEVRGQLRNLRRELDAAKRRYGLCA